MVKATPLDQSPGADARWLVLSPHADDETLGTGALIAQASAGGRLAGVAYLTDGTGSHPAGTARLAEVRRREAALALRRLTRTTIRTAWIGWRDAHPHAPDARAFDRSCDRLSALLRAWQIDAIAVTAASEPHCDHTAAFGLARSAVLSARRRVALFEYHVWSPSRPSRGRVLATAAMPSGKRRHALRAHRSQLTSSMGEDGFRLPRAHQRMPARDLLFLREPLR
jgi:LmbE family N-acetylglucosaminyl deacetylase